MKIPADIDCNLNYPPMLSASTLVITILRVKMIQTDKQVLSLIQLNITMNSPHRQRVHVMTTLALS